MRITNLVYKFLLLLSMAAPCAAATYTVTNTSDSGTGSLRAAVAAANSTSDNDLIVFDIPDCPDGVCRIILTPYNEMIINSASSAGTLAISNPAGPQSLIVSGNNVSRIFRVDRGAHVGIDGMTIEYGSGFYILAPYEGGALANYGHVSISNSVLRGNSANWGGAISNVGGSLLISRSEIAANLATEYGGGIYSIDGTLLIQDSTIANNQGGWEWGEGSGGGVTIAAWENFSWTATFANCTFSGNVGALGGALYLLNSDVPVYFINTTITRNRAGYGGAVAGDGLIGSSMIVRNSIISQNTAATYPDISTNTVILTDLGNNLIGGSPLLGPLENNGGPTRTHALLPGSPAIDAGNSCVLAVNGCGDGNPALVGDQRGFGRSGPVDIGAFELTTQPTVFEVTGRVTTPAGLPIRGAQIVLEDGAGNLRFASANPFGYFRFQDVPAGTYTITVRSKRHGSTSMTISVSSSITDLNLML